VSRFNVFRSRTHFRRYRGRRIPFSCIARPNSFSAWPRAWGLVFMFCAPGLVYGVTECVWSRCGRRVPFSCFAVPDSSSAVSRTSGPIFIFCAPGLVFSGVEGVGSRFHVLLSRTNFQQYRGRRVPFSSFALPDSFSWIPRASGPVFMFCDPGLIFGGTEDVGSRFQVSAPGLVFVGTEGVRSRFHVLRSGTHFRLYRGRRVPFSSFALPDSFSWVPRASGPVFMFCAPRLSFDRTVGAASRFHVMRSRTRFRCYRVRRVPFSCFALPDSFSAVPRASGPVFMFCSPGLIFSGTEGVGSRFHVLLARTRFRRYRGRRIPFSCFALPDSFSAIPRASGPFFMFCAPGIVFGGIGGVQSRFHVLRAGTHFQRYRGRRVTFSCIALPNSFSAVPRASGPVFMFCAPGLVFGGNEGVGSLFHVFALPD
jgi:hypothetical protein